MSSRTLLEEKNRIVLDEGEGYRVMATAKRVGTFAIVAVDWEHPNYGYFADAMLWFKSMHMSGWEAIPIATWCNSYVREEDGKKISLLDEFLDDYPEFKEFFEMEIKIWDTLSPWGFDSEEDED